MTTAAQREWPSGRWKIVFAVVATVWLLGGSLLAFVVGHFGSSMGATGRPLDHAIGLQAIVGVVLLGLLGGTVLFGIGYGIICFRTRGRARLGSLAVALGSPLPLVVLVGALRLGFDGRDQAFVELALRSEPLVDAIKSYGHDHAHPPPNLAALVPEYLPNIPGTGMSRYPEYEYTVFRAGFPGAQLWWYDLGEVPDAMQAMEDWTYTSLGGMAHAILVIVIDTEVRAVDTDRVPRELGGVAFDEERWQQGTGRLSMLMSLLDSNLLLGASAGDLQVRLGETTGRADMIDAGDVRWELRVPCPLGPLNWDVFVYWPTESYPSQMYGGGVERIDGWAYVHE